MGFFADRPFELGKTYFGNGTLPASRPATGDPSRDFEGQEFYVSDFSPTAAGKRSDRVRKIRVVRNTCVINSGGDITTGALRPSRLVQFDLTDATTWGCCVNGYAGASTAGAPTYCYPVDEYLTTTT
jgi:hypothetical protein